MSNENEEYIDEEQYQTEEEFKQAALKAGIPLSVIEGKTKLSDHFSKEYIDFKRNKESNDDNLNE